MAAPFVLLSCAMSVDGYIDDTTADRLPLSNAEDVDRADAARAASDPTLSPDLTTIHTRFLTARYLPKAAS